MREKTQKFFEYLQNEICKTLEGIDGKARFREDIWEREEGGGGRTNIIENGAIFEKGGVNFSAVQGTLPEEFAKKIEMGNGREFFATGISLVLHPHNPFVPTVHANFRYIEKGDAAWFGGGTDLTPSYPFQEDVDHFHKTLKSVCDEHNTEYYPRFKKWCEDYFFIKHRNETRGVGGIFFDYLYTDLEKTYAFVQSAGKAFMPAYLPIVEKRRSKAYTDREREFQSIRRARYAEFNLVYDRGTIFGLETRGRTESILMSLPPHAQWVYDYTPEPGSLEEKAITFFKK